MSRSGHFAAASIGAVLGLCTVTGCAILACCPDIFVPSTGAPNMHGKLINTTTADPNSVITHVKVVKLNNGECKLLLELSSGRQCSLAISTLGDVKLHDVTLVEETFEVDVENTCLWSGFEERRVSLINLQQYLQEQNKRGRLCRYNRVNRRSGVFALQLLEHFYPHDE
jgi:hypothetical protein